MLLQFYLNLQHFFILQDRILTFYIKIIDYPGHHYAKKCLILFTDMIGKILKEDHEKGLLDHVFIVTNDVRLKGINLVKLLVLELWT